MKIEIKEVCAWSSDSETHVYTHLTDSLGKEHILELPEADAVRLKSLFAEDGGPDFKLELIVAVTGVSCTRMGSVDADVAYFVYLEGFERPLIMGRTVPIADRDEAGRKLRLERARVVAEWRAHLAQAAERTK